MVKMIERVSEDENAPLNGGQLLMVLPQFRRDLIDSFVVVVYLPGYHKQYAVAWTQDLSAHTWMYSDLYDRVEDALRAAYDSANVRVLFQS